VGLKCPRRKTSNKIAHYQAESITFGLPLKKEKETEFLIEFKNSLPSIRNNSKV
jgi:hypothetical protein